MPRFKLTQPDQMILLPTTIDRLVDSGTLSQKDKINFRIIITGRVY